LQKIKEDNLSQQFFCKVYSINVLSLKIGLDFRIFFNNPVQLFFGVQEKFTVFEKKLFGDGFNIKGFFDFF